jgi:hypothetical protein
MPDPDGGRREIRDLQVEDLAAQLQWHLDNPPEDEKWMYGEETELGPGAPDGLDRFFLTLDEEAIEDHPLDHKPAPLPPNQIVLEAFWACNGFRDGFGGAIMPSVIEWWISKEAYRLIPAQIADIRDLVPICDLLWRSLKDKAAEEERNNHSKGE